MSGATDPPTSGRPDATPAPEPRSIPFPWRRFLRWLFVGGALGWGTGAWGLHRYGMDELPREGRWDAIVVLGCRVYADGEPSGALTARVRMAVELFHRERAPIIVFTGGIGESGVAESEVSASLAEQLGVPRTAMVLESRSTSTELNARYAAEAIAGRRILVVTDAYHVLRSELVFERYFEEVRGVGTINPRWWPRVKGALREVAALAAYGLLHRL